MPSLFTSILPQITAPGVGVIEGVGVTLGVIVGVGVALGVILGVTVGLGVLVGLAVGVEVATKVVGAGVPSITSAALSSGARLL